MMKLKELTKAEEQVMQVLWNIGKGFVKDVIEQLPEPRPAYNTVSTIIRILEKKGFVGYQSYGKTHEYFPLIDKDTYRRFYLQNFMNNYFGGSFHRLVSFFAKENDISLNEMEELFKLVEKDFNQKNND
jgi:BlaI family penicillinase repressor